MYAGLLSILYLLSEQMLGSQYTEIMITLLKSYLSQCLALQRRKLKVKFFIQKIIN